MFSSLGIFQLQNVRFFAILQDIIRLHKITHACYVYMFIVVFEHFVLFSPIQGFNRWCSWCWNLLFVKEHCTSLNILIIERLFKQIMRETRQKWWGPTLAIITLLWQLLSIFVSTQSLYQYIHTPSYTWIFFVNK